MDPFSKGSPKGASKGTGNSKDSLVVCCLKRQSPWGPKTSQNVQNNSPEPSAEPPRRRAPRRSASQLDKARKLKGVYHDDPGDLEFKETVKDVVFPCLSSSSDEHLLLRSCLGTGMRVGSQNKFCHFLASLVHPASLVVFPSCWCVGESSTTILPLLGKIMWTITTATTLSCVCVGKHITVSRYCRFCERS